jgi:hypothetical protein
MIMWRGFVLGVTIASAAATHALAERRVALVIGNASYTSELPLNNPVNDARRIGARLQAQTSLVSLLSCRRFHLP